MTYTSVRGGGGRTKLLRRGSSVLISFHSLLQREISISKHGCIRDGWVSFNGTCLKKRKEIVIYVLQDRCFFFFRFSSYLLRNAMESISCQPCLWRWPFAVLSISWLERYHRFCRPRIIRAADRPGCSAGAPLKTTSPVCSPFYNFILTKRDTTERHRSTTKHRDNHKTTRHFSQISRN